MKVSNIILHILIFEKLILVNLCFKELLWLYNAVNLRLTMKINSKYFKKDYDLAKSQLVGEGNFAQVYRIYDAQLGDFLAIRKVLKSEAQDEDLDKQKVINEQLMKVHNENILQIFDIIDSKEFIWYITEYCEGGSLWDALNHIKDNRMKEKDAMECVLQISKGVQQLHNHRITHRDLKPENILLKTRYQPGKPLPLVKLADFGLSTKKIIMETIAGTKQYIAPQQAKFQNYTNAVDVWSLGIICDQILHGTPFFSGENNKQVFNKILKLPYKVRDQMLRPTIQQFLVSILKKKPYERPIIAVIRKNIEKILEQINLDKGPEPSKNSPLRKQLQKKKKQQINQSLTSININHQNGDEQSKPIGTVQNNPGTKMQIKLKPQTQLQTKEKKQVLEEISKINTKSSEKDYVTMNFLEPNSNSKKITPYSRRPADKTPQVDKPASESEFKNNTYIRPKLQKQQFISDLATKQNKVQKTPINLNKSTIIVPEKNKVKQSSDNESSKKLQIFDSTTRKNIQPNYVKLNGNFNNTPERAKPETPLLQSNKKIQTNVLQRRKMSQGNNLSYNQIELSKSSGKQKDEERQKEKEKTYIKRSSNINDKVQIYKFQKKKPTSALNNPLSKKDEQKLSIVGIQTYIQGLYQKKIQLIQKKILIGHDRSFIPNANLVNIKQPSISIEQSFVAFKTKMNFLNYVTINSQYQIKLNKGTRDLAQSKQKCALELKNYQQEIKKSFFHQIDNFIDSYIERVLK